MWRARTPLTAASANVRTDEGSDPWDLKPNGAMTNATVSNVRDVDERMLTLSFNGQEKTISVADRAPIVGDGSGLEARRTSSFQRGADGVVGQFELQAWAESGPTGVASGSTGVRAIPVVPLRARKWLHRPWTKPLAR